jgi:MoaA/NifB/PqqE/SkfB family radical SAM enzyme
MRYWQSKTFSNMDAKDLIKNKSLCVLPWTGFELEPSGKVKNCILSKDAIGSINTTPIKDIVNGQSNLFIKDQMMKDKKPNSCEGCYFQEKNRSDLSSISSRLYYLREVGKKTDLSLYDKKENFLLKHVDLRWTNSCNQACVYCGPELSSKWAQELNQRITSNKKARREVKEFVFSNIQNLENVYLAGGEPMLMKENLEFLELLKDKNPNCSVRVNTNLSTTGTGVFDILSSLKNVHWTVSVETMAEEYEYIRHHGSWRDFCNNLDSIRKIDSHKISFNMLHFTLNHMSIFDCIKYLKCLGFHDNSFIIGPLYNYDLNLLNLPSHMVERVCGELKKQLASGCSGYLKNSYENLLSYYTTTTWKKKINHFFQQTALRDQRRGTDCRKVFPKLFEDLDAI